MNYRLSLFAATLVLLIAVGAQLAPRSASAQDWDHHLRRSSFRPDNTASINNYLLADGDVIMITVEEDKGIAADQIEFVLKSDPNVTWWKSIAVYQIANADGRAAKDEIVNSISTQDDDHGPKAMRVTVTNTTNSTVGDFGLHFAKAKVLGVHTNMYILNRAEFFNALKGKRVIFTWQKD